MFADLSGKDWEGYDLVLYVQLFFFVLIIACALFA